MKLNFLLAILALIAFASCEDAAIRKENKEIEQILARIKEPIFPDRIFNVLDIQSDAAGDFDFRKSISLAIDSCSRLGGGTVVVPAGDYYCSGPIHLKSNVHLHFEEGAAITFSQHASDYLPLQFVRWEGVECFNYSPYIYANGEVNIAITGKGRLDGNASGGDFDCRSKQKPSQELMRQMGRDGVPVFERIFGEGHYIRPSFIQLLNCENILISDISITNVPFWVVHPTYCKNVTVRGIKVDSYNLNNDGVDPDSSEDVLIEDCWFNTGDDAIAIKSGRDQDGWRVGKPTRNVIARNCFVQNTLHGIAIGSEMSGGIENIYIRNIEIKKVDQYAIQLKSNLDRGGYIKHVSIRDISIDSTMTAIFFTNDYHSYAGGNSPSEFSHIQIAGITCDFASQMGIDLVGIEQKPIRNINFERIHIGWTDENNRMLNAENITFTDVFINGKEITRIDDLH